MIQLNEYPDRNFSQAGCCRLWDCSSRLFDQRTESVAYPVGSQDSRYQVSVVPCQMGVHFFCRPWPGHLGIQSVADFLAVVVFVLGICLYTLLFCIGVGDILLIFALEDGLFFEVASGCHALDIFEDTEPSLPQPPDSVCGSGERRISRFGRPAKKRFRLPSVKRFPPRPRTRPSLSDRRTGR
jgi:hypothetical protein